MYKNILGNFTSVRKINSSDFLVTSDALSHEEYIRVTNDSFFRKIEPFPTFEFAGFRKNYVFGVLSLEYGGASLCVLLVYSQTHNTVLGCFSELCPRLGGEGGGAHYIEN